MLKNEPNYLLHSGPIGALVYIPPCTSTPGWDKIWEAWEAEVGKDRWNQARSLDPTDVRQNVHIYETLYSAEGMSFSLTPLPGATDDDIQAVKRSIRNNRDVAFMGVNRIKKWIEFKPPLLAHA